MPRLQRHRRFAHWVTLLALVVAALAPGISHALALAQDAQAPWAPVCSVDRSVQRGKLPMQGPTSVFDHCPYCALAGELPVLPCTPLAGLPRISRTDAMPAIRLQVPSMAPTWRRAQQQAPPPAA